MGHRSEANGRNRRRRRLDLRRSAASIAFGSLERARVKYQVHLRCAHKLQDLCFKNGGIYIKLGEHIGQLIMQLWSGCSPILITGTPPRCTLGADPPLPPQKRFCIVLLPAELLAMPRWLVAEFRESLPKDGKRPDSDFLDVAIKELELLVEARNSEKCLHNFQKLLPHTDRIYVPLVYWNLSTSKLLTVEFMDGMRVDDVKGIQNMGIRPYHVSKLVSEAFAEMIFKHGFVHCDPHAANLLVRPLPSGKRTI